ATFLIPYCIMLLAAGLPLYFLELALGQYVSLGPNMLFQQMAPIFSGVGWAMVAVTLLTAIHYNIILAWSLFYTFSSFTLELPWASCNNSYNTAGCYSYKLSQECKEDDLVYYNKSCVQGSDLCGMKQLAIHNSSFCVSAENSSILLNAENTIEHRIIASQDFFDQRMLDKGSHTWGDMGTMQWEIVGCLGLAWLLVAAALARGVRSSGKVVYFTAIFPYIVLTIFFIRGITLEGAYKGIEFYIMRPNMTLLMEVDVWREASTQIFYSLGVSFGSLITLSSYNQFSNNCMRDAIIVSFVNCATSVYAGFAVFSILGFLATEQGKEVGDVVDSGPGLAFIVYPEAFTMMPAPTVWSILFFVMLLTLGLDSQFAYVETIISSILDQWENLRPYKLFVVAGMCSFMFVCGLTMCLQGGIYMFELFFTWSAGLSLIFIAVLEVVVFVYIYGFRRLMSMLEEMNIHVCLPLHGYWAVTWMLITPISLGMILVMSLTDLDKAKYEDYEFPIAVQILAWLLLLTSILVIPVVAIIVYFKSGKRGHELIQPTSDFCPAHIRGVGGTRETSMTTSTAELARPGVSHSLADLRLGVGASQPRPQSLDDGIFSNSYDNPGFRNSWQSVGNRESHTVI
ncbi:unnamed protein product, partial [Meganyctiphanes norvegica]